MVGLTICYYYPLAVCIIGLVQLARVPTCNTFKTLFNLNASPSLAGSKHVSLFVTNYHSRIKTFRIDFRKIANPLSRFSRPSVSLSQTTTTAKSDKKGKVTSRKRKGEEDGREGNVHHMPSLSLDSLTSFSPVSVLRGVGPAALSALQSLNIQSIADLIFHLPSGVIDRTNIFDSLLSAHQSEMPSVTVTLTVVRLDEPFQQRSASSSSRPFVVHCVDSFNTPVKLIYFVYQPFVWLSTKARLAKCTDKINVFGKLVVSPHKSERLYTYDFYNPEFESAAELPADAFEKTFSFIKIEPEYKLKQKIKPKAFQKLVLQGVSSFDKECSEIIQNTGSTGATVTDLTLLSLLQNVKSSIKQIHVPLIASDSLPDGTLRQGLALTELTLLQFQLIVKQRRLEQTTLAKQRQDALDVLSGQGDESQNKFALTGPSEWSSALRLSLPFELTPGQKQATDEILQDMSYKSRMVRLGDVGSGKSIVSYLAMVRAVECGKLSVLLAPTEILARQHYKSINRYLRGANINIAVSLLTSSCVTVQGRRALLEDLRSNKVDILIGTHSLLSDSVLEILRDDSISSSSDNHKKQGRGLGLVVIDEEQRFGVDQRESLANITNALYTTATPIPRSLAQFYRDSLGASSISTLTDKPPLKRPVKTTLVSLSQVDRLIERIKVHLENGTKVFWVTPSLRKQPEASDYSDDLESEDNDNDNNNSEGGGIIGSNNSDDDDDDGDVVDAEVANEGGLRSSRIPVGSSAEERFELLSGLLPGKVGLLHGQLSGEEKATVMQQFEDAQINLLVCTTVVECGIDVPDASICVIDTAENFGLSQLHQIRGRIGRGSGPSSETLPECHCILLHKKESSEAAGAIERLQTLVDSSDGFFIADADLRLRGPGDLYGLLPGGRQSGKVAYRATRLPGDLYLVPEAKATADKLYQQIVNVNVNVNSEEFDDRDNTGKDILDSISPSNSFFLKFLFKLFRLEV